MREPLSDFFEERGCAPIVRHPLPSECGCSLRETQRRACDAPVFLLHWLQMNKEKRSVFSVTCPVCQSSLWIDPLTRDVVQSEKGEKKIGSLDELLAKEKKRQSEFDRKFEATAAMEKEKKKKAEERFSKAFAKVDSED